jgi:septum formation protein
VLSKLSAPRYHGRSRKGIFHKNADMPPLQLILASTSPYRRRLLARLRVAFSVMDPDIDETPLPGESAVQRASRLAQCKSEAPSATDTLIIGSDQVACLDGEILRKPGSVDNAIAQLMRCSNQTLVFWTAVSVRSTVTGLHKQRLVPSEVQMRFADIARSRALCCSGQPTRLCGQL